MSPIKLANPGSSPEPDVEMTGLDKKVYAQPSLTAGKHSLKVDEHSSGKFEVADEDSEAEKSIISQVIEDSHFDYMAKHPVDWAFSMLTGKPIVDDSVEKAGQKESAVTPTDVTPASDDNKTKRNIMIGIVIAALVVVVGYELYGSFVSPVPHLWSYPRKKKGVVRFVVNGPYKTSASLVDTSVVWWILKRNRCKFSIGNKQKELSRLVAHESLSFYLNKNRCYVTSVEMMENCRVAVNFVTVHDTQLVEAKLISTAALGSVDAFVDK